jgi:alpha-mannosidase
MGESSRRSFPEGRIFYVVPHSHIDVEWYWTFDTTREWTADILGRALAFLRQDPDYRFTQDQVVLLKSFWEGLDDEERAVFRQAIAEKRFAIVGGTYIQPELAEPSGEALVRQILVGQAWLQATFGVRARCGWFIDTFGQIPQIPQILRRAGYKYNVFWRDIPPEVDFEAMPADFFWESPDGSRILTHWMPGGYSTTREEARTALKHSGRHVFLPLGSDVSRPRQDSIAACRAVASWLKDLGEEHPQVRMATALEYFDAVAAGAEELPVLSYDFSPPDVAADLRGTYDGRIELKKLNRTAEQALYNAEVLATLGYVAGRPYPAAEFAVLWEKLLFTQFHDTIGGSHCDSVYVPAMARDEEVLDGASRVATESLRAFFSATGSDGEWLAVFNTLSWPRSEICRIEVPQTTTSGPALVDENGRTVQTRLVHGEAVEQPAPPNARGPEDGAAVLEFLAADVPATGWRAYRLVHDRPAGISVPGRTVSADRLENVHFRVVLDRATGDLTSIWDKKLGRELLAGPGNVIVAAREENPDMEGPIFLTGEEARSSDYRATSVEVSQDGLALRVRARSDFQDCAVMRETALYEFVPRIDFRTTLRDFTGGDVMIKASFPLKIDWSHAEKTCETAYAATPKPGGHFAAQTWADCSDDQFGVALLNCGMPGYWVTDNRLELVLMRSLANYTGYQSRGLRLGLSAYERTSDMALAREHGSHSFRYSLLAHAGTWREGGLSHQGQSLNTPFVTLAGLPEPPKAAPGSAGFVSFAPDFTMTALKLAENGQGVIVRGFETRGQAHAVRMRVSPWVKRASRATLLEEPGEPLSLMDGTVGFGCAPHEIVTLLLMP